MNNDYSQDSVPKKWLAIPACVADAITVDDVPLGRGTFGIFRGSDRVIYIREIY